LDAARKFTRRFAMTEKIALNDPSGRERIATWTQQSGMLGFSFRHGGKKSLSEWMRTQLLESAYRSYAPRISFPPSLELSGVQVVVDDLATSRADSKGRKAQEFVNEEVLRELDKQCFFKALQKK
jgi:hypothetical protein